MYVYVPPLFSSFYRAPWSHTDSLCLARVMYKCPLQSWIGPGSHSPMRYMYGSSTCAVYRKFHLPQQHSQFRDYVKSNSSKTSLNKDSIVKPVSSLFLLKTLLPSTCYMFTLQALTSYYLGTLSDELCACGLHALALPVETLRLIAVDCLLQSVSASQLVHLRYSYNHY